MVIEFEMPGDQDWDGALWANLGVGAEWERLGRAFYNLGVEAQDDEGISLEFPDANEAEVRKVVDQARNGDYGPDVAAYWAEAVEAAAE